MDEKAVEMYMINLLITKNAAEITQFFENIFAMFNGVINLTELDIREGVHLVDVSRRIFQRLVEANEFEMNFCGGRSKIPKTFFARQNLTVTLKDKAEIFALNYISKSKAESKSINQSLKRNHCFKAFGLPLPKVVDALKRRKLLEVYSLDELNREGRRKKRYRITYNVDDSDHFSFFEKYQAIYPGEAL